jgi:hypothetical protein
VEEVAMVAVPVAVPICIVTFDDTAHSSKRERCLLPLIGNGCGDCSARYKPEKFERPSLPAIKQLQSLSAGAKQSS